MSNVGVQGRWERPWTPC